MLNYIIDLSINRQVLPHSSVKHFTHSFSCCISLFYYCHFIYSDIDLKDISLK